MDAKRTRPRRSVGRLSQRYEPTYARGQDAQGHDGDIGGGVRRDVGFREGLKQV